MGKKEKIILSPPVVKKYKVEVLNKLNEPIKIILGNQGHCMETTVAGNAQWPRTWEMQFTDVPDIRVFTSYGKKAFGLRDISSVTNSFIVDGETITCKNPSPLLPRNTAASPDIYGAVQEEHREILHNTSRKECTYFIGDDWHNVSGTLDSGNQIIWKLVIAQISNMVTHHWCKIDELGSRRNKFSVLGIRSLDGRDMDDVDLDYRDHKYEINDNWELLRDGGMQKLWKFDWE